MEPKLWWVGRKTFLEHREQVSIFQQRGGVGAARAKAGFINRIPGFPLHSVFSEDGASHISCFCPLQFMGPEIGLKANSNLAREWEGVRGDRKYPFLKKGCNHLADYLTLWNAVRSETGSPFSVATAPRSSL